MRPPEKRAWSNADIEAAVSRWEEAEHGWKQLFAFVKENSHQGRFSTGKATQHPSFGFYLASGHEILNCFVEDGTSSIRVYLNRCKTDAPFAAYQCFRSRLTELFGIPKDAWEPRVSLSSIIRNYEKFTSTVLELAKAMREAQGEQVLTVYNML